MVIAWAARMLLQVDLPKERLHSRAEHSYRDAAGEQGVLTEVLEVRDPRRSLEQKTCQAICPQERRTEKSVARASKESRGAHRG